MAHIAAVREAITAGRLMLEQAAATRQGAAAARAQFGVGTEVPVIAVPGNSRALVAMTLERVERLTAHIDNLVRRARAEAEVTLPAVVADGKEAGFACAVCKGHCCLGGADHGYISAATVRRVMQDQDAEGLAARYREQVGERTYQYSCIFHGETGCTLAPEMRSEVCVTYYCGDLKGFWAGPGDQGAGVLVYSREGDGTALLSL